ncbi:glycerol-3-phosphate dehydrogenase/oxidase [Raineyella sp. LH-20]|uniref:glycerol-3-phosphate dehydrogenase/oxidase n=1 Tax=Raineyella sp. LH-20 TaxID=3081204 RepID=UPI002955C124|nr:glycerol-3-phosphate dehydrogenase/oxidase [Raineyella sp. LH-20]WOP19050.1 glycerol-3-phosphate dehydrogenase/oxidase [Raineyella sp. LH-20]
MKESTLTAQSRSRALEEMADDGGLDLLVVGGGVTGAGIALDAVTRGLRTGLVEMQDWAAGTSSRSSRLVHGGLRYLYQLDLHLVSEALAERGLLLDTIAPHLVHAQPFLWPLRVPLIERGYSALGVGLYDLIARFHGGRVPIQRHYDKAGALGIFPDIRPGRLSGAIRFYDARVDDARLVVDLVRTAVSYGALAASRTRVVDFVRRRGAVTGAVLHDLEADREITVRARHVINATGVWTEQTEGLAGPRAQGLKVLASKGVHIVVPKERIRGRTGLFLRTSTSVLFIIPWPDHWVIGTTDTAWSEQREAPVATAADIDYILDQANAVLRSRLTRDDILASYAGLRPLLQPLRGTPGESASVSREHTVARVAPGLSAIAGGKLTTYRRMAQDAVDFALGAERTRAQPSITERVPLVGAVGYEATRAQAGPIARRIGWDRHRVEHLLSRYGAELTTIADLVRADPDLGRPLAAAPAYLRAEVAFAVTHEGALHLADVLRRRVRLAYEMPEGGCAALDEIGDIVAPLLGWDAATLDREKQRYRREVEAQRAASEAPDDATASALMAAALAEV